MKKFMKEITLFIIQLLIFYLFPLFAKQIDAIGMVLFLITATFVLSALMGIISTNKIKYFYPLITAILLFLPCSFIITKALLFILSGILSFPLSEQRSERS